MSSDRWSTKKLDRLADVVSQLAIQVQQMNLQIVQLGDRVDRTCTSLDGLVNTLQNSKSTESVSPQPADFTQYSGVQALQQQLQQLTQQLSQLSDRVKVLEHRGLTTSSPTLQPLTTIEDEIEDDIEDEPDEILWDFMDPAEQ